MRLTFSQIKKAVFGAAVSEENGKIAFHRFTEIQTAHFSDFDKLRAQSSAGVRLEFVTDSDFLSFAFTDAWVSSNRGFFYADLLIDGCLMAHVGTDLGRRPEGGPTVRPLPDLSHTVKLDPGVKRVTLYPPAIACARLEKLELSDGASFEPVRPARRIVSFGDSITEGMDATFPSYHYLNRVAKAFDAEAFNFAIAGGCMDPGILEGDLPPTDLITVAYGTNDFRHASPTDFRERLSEFFRRVNAYYPTTPVFVMPPFYRLPADESGESFEIGTLDEVREAIGREAGKYDNVSVLNSKFFVPPMPSFFGDGRLHPNELGSVSLSDHLKKEIRGRLGWKEGE
ncbi:MAG: SGNH/GDSL hydrolase family protein [Clostridia bacterium]|nr:SGNH/GDSL hydrolase family protein [Clostridia bacterium]